jgi:hypothetical protein
LGLVVAPRIRFLQKSQNKISKDSQPKDSEDENDSEEENQIEDDQHTNDTSDEQDNNKTFSQNVLIKKTEVKIQNTKKKIIRRLPADKNKDEVLNFNEVNNEGDDNDDSLFTVKSVFKPKINKKESDEDEDDV